LQISSTPKIRSAPELKIKHKEPKDKWWKITLTPIQFDQEILAKGSTASNQNHPKVMKS